MKKSVWLLLLTALAVNACSRPQKGLELTIVGDIMLSRGVETAIQERGMETLLEDLKPVFLEDDLSIANLECPITDYGRGTSKPRRLVFKADPANTRYLKEAGLDLLNLANNHAMDYHSQGLTDTMEHLNHAGLCYVGAGSDSSQDMSYVFEKNGIRVGVLAYSLFGPEGFSYSPHRANINYLLPPHYEKLKEDLEGLQADVKIVYFHWGIEFVPYLSDTQKELGHLAVDYGADFVVGTHPHVIQKMEVYQGKYIYYSLGNCIFDHQIPRGTDEGLLLSVKVNKSGVQEVKERRFKIQRGKAVLEQEQPE